MAENGGGFFAALGLSFKVLPYALFRFAHWSLFTAISVVMVIAALGIGTGLAIGVNKWAGVVVMFGGLVPIFWFWMPFVERKTFGAKCAHIAILTELVTKGRVGSGQEGQLAYAKQIVDTRLHDMTSIWDVNRSVNRSLRKLTETLNFIDKWLPIDISFIKRGIYALVNGASRYLEAVVLSYGLARGDREFAAPALDGLTYCAQNSGKMFRAAIGVIILEKVMMAPLWIMAALSSVGGVFAATFASQGGELAALQADATGVIKAAPIPFLVAFAMAVVVGGVIALLMVRTVRESFIQPTLTTMVMLRFHKLVQNQALNQEWKQKIQNLEGGISSLHKLQDRASSFA
ncbi:MAG: hypothetical protein KUG77_17015 [Nannocystaceae bacterium]|nr:hypothetical protein [Nannocystaceae bacterium]